MDLDSENMETPKSSSVDIDMTSSHTTPTAASNDAEQGPFSKQHARHQSRHIVPTVEPANILPSQQLPQHQGAAASVKSEPVGISGTSKFKATNNGAVSPYHVLFSQPHETAAASPATHGRFTTATNLFQDVSADEAKSSAALSATQEPADPSPDSDDEPAANDELASSVQSPDDDDNLSPPPDSIDDQVLEDQIVVGKGDAAVANANANVDGSTSAKPKVAYADEMDMDGDENGTDPIKSTRIPKRKRTSLYDDLAEEKMDSGAFLEDKDEEDTVASTPASDINGSLMIPKEAAKPILVGIWRDSEAPDPDQHIVKGFIDSRDRLRTRIQQVNRAGDNITGRFPLKPGPGGSWVTFHNIIFDEHLVHLDQHQVKEYVKLRSAMQDEPGEDPKANDKLAVQKAIKSCSSRGPLPEGALPPLIAYGANIPEHARISYSRAEKRRRTAAAIGAQSTHDISPVVPQQPLQAGPGPVFAQAMQLAPHPPISADLPGKRPTRVVLGYWNESAEPRLEDKHAVFGILGSNDMFRVKVGRETRDGRPVTSNFPQGAGALWINAHQWQREAYLEDLSREELKEFTRVRQCQIDHGEHDDDHRNANIDYALIESRRRAAYLGSHKKHQSHNTHVVPANNHFMDISHMPQAGSMPVHETRQNIRRGGPPAINPATSFHHQEQALGPGAGFRAANRGNTMPPPLSTDPRLQRAESLASNAVARIEANQAKVEQRDAQVVNSCFAIEEEKFPHGSLLSVGQAGEAFRDHLGRLNNVWSQQEAQRIRSSNEDAKMHMSIKYERKATGPFAGKLVSQGNIISIDGEDYVEYRVLTKPSFI